MLTAKEIMTEDVITVKQETSVEDAAQILSDNRISGVPVVNEDKLVGILTEKDLLFKNKKLDPPNFISLTGGVLYLEDPRNFEEEFKKFIAVKVEDLMTRGVITINQETPLEEIATIMTEKDVNRLPVMKDDQIVGIVTRADLVRNMTGVEV